MVLGTKMLDDGAYGNNQSVAFSFMQQLLVKSALREWGDDARAAREKEVNQLHWRETFIPRRMSELTRSNELRFFRVTCSLGRSGQKRHRQEWSQVETRSVVM